MLIKVLGVLLLVTGLFIGGVGIWRKMNPGGPVFFGNVTDSIRNLYGVRKPGNLPIIIGVISCIVGFVLVILT